MTKSTITRERLEEIRDCCWMDDLGLSMYELSELASMALVAMDSEPVAEVVSIYGDTEVFGQREIRPLVGIQQMPCGTKLYRHAQPASERDQVRSEHAEWSQATFGNVGPVGPLKHLSKEALEAAEQPGDLSEWADMQFLLWDAQRRAGITDEQITQAMIEKLAVNKLREWPEPKDGEPRLHIKEQPAPAFLDFDNVLESLDYEVRCNAWESEHVLKACQATYDACRAAMLQELQKSAGAEATCRSNENVQDLQVDNSPVIPDGSASMLRRWLAFGRGMQNAGSQLPHNLIAETEAMLAAAPTGIPMIPDGYVMVPKVATEKMLIAGLEEANPLGGLIDWDASRGDCNTREQVQEIFKAMLAAAPQEVKGE